MDNLTVYFHDGYYRGCFRGEHFDITWDGCAWVCCGGIIRGRSPRYAARAYVQFAHGVNIR